jgi:hypothetical protein
MPVAVAGPAARVCTQFSTHQPVRQGRLPKQIWHKLLDVACCCAMNPLANHVLVMQLLPQPHAMTVCADDHHHGHLGRHGRLSKLTSASR